MKEIIVWGVVSSFVWEHGRRRVEDCFANIAAAAFRSAWLTAAVSNVVVPY
jgi:hypothetical protein